MMECADEAEHLALFEAMVQWCDPAIVERIRVEERNNIPFHLHQFPAPKLLPEAEWLQPKSGAWSTGGELALLFAAWRDLERDFLRRVERGELYLEGVLSIDDANAQPEAIPNFWAAELTIDTIRNAVTRGERRYLAVTVSRRPSPWAPLEGRTEPVAAPRTAITSASVRELSDDEVLLLLEDHARRVVEDNADLIAPAKISLMPIIRRRMEYRAANGGLASSLAAECRVLADWIGDKVRSHQTPTANSIENSLRKDYAALKARSNGMKA